MRHTERQESMIQTSRKISESACERIQMSNLTEKAFKAAIIYIYILKKT